MKRWIDRHASSAHALGLCVLVFCAGPARSGPASIYPPDADVPAPGTGYITAARPGARMLADNRTCELIAGLRTLEGEVVQARLQMFRDGEDAPFLDVSNREDRLVILHFAAQPNEVVIGRAYRPEPGRRKMIYGPRMRVTCVAGTVRLGPPVPVR